MINENLKSELSNAKDKNGCIEWKGNIRLAFLLVSTLRSSDLTIRQFSDLYSIDAGIVGRLNEGLSAQGMYWQQLSDAIAQLPVFIRRRKVLQCLENRS
jgi:hypothetical protein